MAYSMMSAVEALGVNAIQVAHAFREVGFRRFDNEMIVIAHQTVGVAYPVESLANLTEYIQPRYAILIREIDVFAPITTGGDVIERAGKFKS